jgi:hypothetical protein
VALVGVLGNDPDEDLHVLLAPVLLDALVFDHPEWEGRYLSMRRLMIFRMVSSLMKD